MPSPREYQTEAIIIKKTKLGEADRILTLYTPDLGKIQAVAKGVRRPKSKMAGHLELLTHSAVSLSRGRGSLDTITGSQTIDGFLPLKSDLQLTSYGLYISELVNQFAEERIEDRHLFQLLLETMQRLANSNNHEITLRYFELHLLNEVGYRPELRQCVACPQPLEPVINAFSSSMGGMLCPHCLPNHPAIRPMSLNALKVLRLLQSDDYATAYRLKLDPKLSSELETVLRGYLKYLLERDIKSVAWMDTLRS